MRAAFSSVIAAALVALSSHGTPAGAEAAARGQKPVPPFNDSHVHLTNYVQKGPDARSFLRIMGSTVGRAVLFGIPLQQTWSYRIDGADAPTYYLQSDAPLYYDTFTDAFIAMQYRSLDREGQARFDPMITGFNPADMYAADQVRRVLQTFPGVFVGIGEFSVHKEFVSSKIAGVTPSLLDPALDRLLDFAEEAGLLVLLHCDVDVPFAKEGVAPAYLEPLKALFRRHPKTTIVWAHLGLGRVIHPVDDEARVIEEMLADPTLGHVNFDISWTETAKYLEEPGAPQRVASVINRYPERFLFGTDEVAVTDPRKYYEVVRLYDPLFERLEPRASELLRKSNYERLFDQARRRVRAWEKANVVR